MLQHLLRRDTKSRPLQCDDGLEQRLKVSHGKEKGVKDLNVPLKCHNMVPKKVARKNGCI